ncbi:uncharacterized protein LOC143491005 isoform X2 [Brachyhypopomus gauderio]|uniref:uncharacterized protein LOC143491005 isoform X2 n=1 Tax=Brachyhypopomus gauderio TaxID=698409 RepID=UPI0040417339
MGALLRIQFLFNDLVFKDSGDYYCGVEKWGFDISIKVKIIVKKGRTPESTDLPWSSTVIPVAESTLHEQMSSTLDAQFSNKISKWPIFSDYSSYELQLMIAGLISLLLLSVVVGLVVFYWGRLNSNSTCKNKERWDQVSVLQVSTLKSSGPENPNLDPPAPIKMEDGDHMYDEILGVYSLAGPVKEEDTSTTSCTIQYLHTAREDCSPYSLIAPH